MFGKIFMIHYLLYFFRLRALANALSVGCPSSILLDSSVILGADARKRGRRARVRASTRHESVWLIGQCNSRLFFGLAIMGYEPLYPALQIW